MQQSDKKLLFAIDIGTAEGKMAQAACYMGDKDLPFHIASSSLLALPDGRAYSNFQESDVFIYCWEYLRECQHIWKDAALIGIEQQHSKTFHLRERQCLITANCFMTILKTLHIEGKAPPVVSLVWRKNANVQVTGGHKAKTPGEQHRQNKETSVISFLTQYPHAKERLDKICNGGPIDDVVEACLMLKAMEADFDNLISKPFRNHNVRLQFIGNNVPKEDRVAPLKPMATPFSNRIPPEHLSNLYRAYLKTTRANKKARESKKMAKSASDLLLRFVGSGGNPKHKKQKREDDVEVVSDV